MLKIIKAIIQAIKRRLRRRDLNLDKCENDYEEFAENIIGFACAVAALTSISYVAAVSAAVAAAEATATAARAAANLLDNDFLNFLHDNVDEFMHELDELAEPPHREKYENCNKTTHKKKRTAAAAIQTVMYYKKPVRYTSGVPPNV